MLNKNVYLKAITTFALVKGKNEILGKLIGAEGARLLRELRES